MELIHKYFPHITELQIAQFKALEETYKFWNDQINVISRKDFDHFYERHVLHSLGIAKIMSFKDESRILDIGTGGGFPGIPLAILFPNCHFHLVDSIGKKIKVVEEVSTAIGLDNVTATQERAEKVNGQYDFIVSRAVTQMPTFLSWIKGKIKKEQKNILPNGVLYLKGGDLSEEMKGIKNYFEIHALSDIFEEAFFETKKVVYLQPQ